MMSNHLLIGAGDEIRFAGGEENLANELAQTLGKGDGFITSVYLLPQSLKAWRKDSGMTLKELSKKCGLSVSYLSDMETGKTTPSLNSLQKLANAHQKKITIDFGFCL